LVWRSHSLERLHKILYFFLKMEAPSLPAIFVLQDCMVSSLVSQQSKYSPVRGSQTSCVTDKRLWLSLNKMTGQGKNVHKLSSSSCPTLVLQLPFRLSVLLLRDTLTTGTFHRLTNHCATYKRPSKLTAVTIYQAHTSNVFLVIVTTLHLVTRPTASQDGANALFS
jgi:hypothetical protein